MRQQATDDLRRLGPAGAAILRPLLAAQPPLEVRRRVEALLALLEHANPRERLRTLRALELLERIGDAEARRLLRTLADGAPVVWLTVQAQAALRRCGEGLPKEDMP